MHFLTYASTETEPLKSSAIELNSNEPTISIPVTLNLHRPYGMDFFSTFILNFCRLCICHFCLFFSIFCVFGRLCIKYQISHFSPFFCHFCLLVFHVLSFWVPISFFLCCLMSWPLFCLVFLPFEIWFWFCCISPWGIFLNALNFLSHL